MAPQPHVRSQGVDGHLRAGGRGSGGGGVVRAVRAWEGLGSGGGVEEGGGGCGGGGGGGAGSGSGRGYGVLATAGKLCGEHQKKGLYSGPYQ